MGAKCTLEFSVRRADKRPIRSFPTEMRGEFRRANLLCESFILTRCSPTADMGGAACVLSSMLAIAKLRIPINMVVCIPLTENMPSGKATKPGDIIVSMAGKTIEVDNTDAEG